MFSTCAKRAVCGISRFKTAFSSTAPKAFIAQFGTKKRVAIDGNEAAAHAIYQVSDAAMLFPITPSSGMGEHCDAWANKGLKNVFGQKVVITEMQVNGFSGSMKYSPRPEPQVLSMAL